MRASPQFAQISPGRVPGTARAHDGAGFARRVVARRGGRPLDGGVQARMEAAFGTDLRAVRVHTDAGADALNRSLSASASTVGDHIYFRAGAYRPGTPGGRRLLAHELGHVVQQRDAPSGAGLSFGPVHSAAERQAEAGAARIAAGGTVHRAALTPVSGGVMQRRYLDAPAAEVGLRRWRKDTTVTKGLTEVSREKLRGVDVVLAGVLSKRNQPNWQTASLPLLETALTLTKYGTPGAKGSETFTKRARAVVALQQEIKAAKPVAPPSPAVGALQQAGFLRDYLESLPATDLQSLYQADQALAAGNVTKAQSIFDVLNPPVPSTGTQATPLGWKAEAFESIVPGQLFDFKRTGDALMAAQRQLIAHHAADIGGDYAEMMSYKPYKARPLTSAEVKAGRRHFTNRALRDWDTRITQGVTGGPLAHAIAAAPAIAAASTAASDARRQAQGLPVKAPKVALTDEEVTALRIYTADEYREMNAVFRDFRVDAPTKNWAKYSAIAKLAVSGLGKLPKARNTISYRGDNDVNFGGHAGVLKQGGMFRLPNFYSTTTNPASAFGGALGYVFHNTRRGRLIEDFSAYRGEKEVLIPPGTPFQIMGEFHLRNGAWEQHDGAPGLSPAAATLEAKGKQRQMILELAEK